MADFQTVWWNSDCVMLSCHSVPGNATRQNQQHLNAVTMGLKGHWSYFVDLLTFNLKQLAKFLLIEMWPIKGMQYFERKVTLIEKIGKDRRNAHCLYQIYILLVLSFLLSVVQCFYYDHTLGLLTFDYIGVLNFGNSVKMSKAMINICTYYFYKYSYFKLGEMKHFPFMRETFVNGDRTLVLGSTLSFRKLITWSLAFYQVLVVAFELWLIGAYIQFCVALYGHSFDQPHLWCLAYLSMSMFFVLFSVTVLLICVGGWAGSVALSVLCGFFCTNQCRHPSISSASRQHINSGSLVALSSRELQDDEHRV